MLPTSQHDLLEGESPQQENSDKRIGKRPKANISTERANTENESFEMRHDDLASKLARIESVLSDVHELVLNRQTIKDSYTTLEVAKVLNKKPYTVREWCRLQRVNADKAMCGRGSEEEWRISHEELVRIQNEGLLPPPSRY